MYVNEQYLVQGLLVENPRWEVLLSLYALARERPEPSGPRFRASRGGSRFPPRCGYDGSGDFGVLAPPRLDLSVGLARHRAHVAGKDDEGDGRRQPNSAGDRPARHQQAGREYPQPGDVQGGDLGVGRKNADKGRERAKHGCDGHRGGAVESDVAHVREPDDQRAAGGHGAGGTSSAIRPATSGMATPIALRTAKPKARRGFAARSRTGSRECYSWPPRS
jgi:hypothetical protein